MFQALLDLVSSRADKYGMKWSIWKRALVMDTLQNSRDFFLSGQRIWITAQAIYLGMTLTARGLSTLHTMERVRNKRKVLTALAKGSKETGW